MILFCTILTERVHRLEEMQNLIVHINKDAVPSWSVVQHPSLSSQSAAHVLSDVAARIQVPLVSPDGGGSGGLLAGGEEVLVLPLVLPLVLALPKLSVGLLTYVEHFESLHEPIDDMGLFSAPSITIESLDTPVTLARTCLKASALLLNESLSVGSSNMIWRVAGSSDGKSEDSSKGDAESYSQPPPSAQQFPGVV